MWGIAIASMILGASLLFVSPEFGADWARDASRAEARASSFAIYHTAAVQFATANPAYTGVVPAGSLVFPGHYVNQGFWIARMESGVVYVYGAVPGQIVSRVVTLMGDVPTVGVKQGSVVFSPVHGTTTTSLPSWVPAGALVSVN